MNDEAKYGTGVAHLTEHTVFQTAGSESYLDRLKRGGAEDTNGQTTPDDTLFHASVPADKGEWLIQTFAELLRPRKFTDVFVDKSKKEIALELSSRAAVAPGAGSQAGLIPLLKSEFGIDVRTPTSGSDLSRIAGVTKRLTVRHVQAFFDRYYHPHNMVVFVVGRFEPRRMLAFLESQFGTFPNGIGKPRVEQAVTPREAPLFLSVGSTSAYFIQIGTKFWNISARDELVLRAYLDDLALRLMQYLRTERSQTYTVSPLVYGDTRRFGFGIIHFETTAEDYSRNYQYVSDLIDAETGDPGLKPADVQRIRDEYLRHLAGFDSDVPSLMKAAQQLYFFHVSYHLPYDPFSLMARLSDQDFKRGLAQLFDPDRSFTILMEPPLYSRAERGLIELLVIGYALFLVRLRHLRPINETTGILFTQRVSSSAFTRLLRSLASLMVLGLFGLAAYGILQLERNSFGYPRGFVLRDYVQGSFISFIAWSLFFRLLSRLPHRIVISEDQFVIRNWLYRSWIYPRGAVSLVEVRSTAWALASFRPGVCFGYFGLLRPGVWIELRNGRAYYLGFKNPEQVAESIRTACGAPVRRTPTGTLRLDELGGKRAG
jgi:predicted Zn-dependent peptidase